MPGYKQHLVGGFCVYSILLYLLRFSCPVSCFKAIELLICCLAGSLFPDIDIKSRGQNYFYSFILLALLFCLLYKKHQVGISVSIVSFVPLLVRHRGLCHRLWFIIGIPLTVWLLCHVYQPFYAQFYWYNTLFFIAGAISHLWLDLGLKRMFRF